MFNQQDMPPDIVLTSGLRISMLLHTTCFCRGICALRRVFHPRAPGQHSIHAGFLYGIGILIAKAAEVFDRQIAQSLVQLASYHPFPCHRTPLQARTQQ